MICRMCVAMKIGQCWFLTYFCQKYNCINFYGKRIPTKPQALINHLAITINDAQSECSCKVHSSSIKTQTFDNTRSTVVYLQISLSSLLIH